MSSLATAAKIARHTGTISKTGADVESFAEVRSTIDDVLKAANDLLNGVSSSVSRHIPLPPQAAKIVKN